MHHVILNNGVEMPILGFGVFQIPDDETQAAVEAALAAGEIAELIGKLKGEGHLSMLIVEQNLKKILNVVDCCSLLVSGRMMLSGKPEDLLSRSDIMRTYLGLS